jgi:hypothetical protein
LHPKELFQSVAFAVCPNKEWQARVVVSFYDLVRSKNEGCDDDNTQEEERVETMVEIRIQISYLCRPLSPRYRETTYHLKLTDGAKDDYPQLQQQVEFSQDRKFLSILVFHPHQHSSTVLVFQLRRPRTDWTTTANPPLPIPSYVTNPNNGTNNDSDSRTSDGSSRINQNSVAQHPVAPVVATNPKFVSVWGITAICRIPISMSTAPTNTNPMDAAFGTQHHSSATPSSTSTSTAALRPLLLAVCHDGALVWLDLKSAQAIATGILPVSKSQQLPVSSMHASPTSCLENGTVALVSSCNNNSSTFTSESPECILATWSLESTTPRQRTLPKRASTGNVTVDHSIRRSSEQKASDHGSVPASPRDETSPKKRNRPAPQRSFSDTLQSMWKSPGKPAVTAHKRQLRRRDTSNAKQSRGARSSSRDGPRRGVSRHYSTNSTGSLRDGLRRFESFRSMNTADLADRLNQMKKLPSLGNLVTNTASDNNQTEEEEEQAALQRRKLFVLQELQKRSPNKSWMTQEHRQLLAMEMPDDDDGHDIENEKKQKSRNRITSSASNGISVLQQAPNAADDDNAETGNASQTVQRRFPRRRSDPDKNGVDKIKRQMKIGILSTWSGTAGNSQGEHQHLNSRKVVVGVCFGALSTVLCVVYQYATTVTERRQRLAQVLTISEAGNVTPVASLFLSLDQVEQAPSIRQPPFASESRNGLDGSIHMTAPDLSHRHSVQSRFGTEFDHSSNTFVVSAIFGNSGHWVGCVWDWRADAIGWMVQHKSLPNLLWSRLSLGRDSNNGFHLVQIFSLKQESHIRASVGKVEMSKHVVRSGYLSPSSAAHPALFEPASLLLSSDYVAYPRATKKPSNVNLLELEWKNSTLPSHYVSSYGPPTIAAVGPTNAKSIAVASGYGLCVLDARQRTRWKQFPLIDERVFTVVAMTWWEGRGTMNEKNDESDDLLITIIRTSNGHQYLSCWSSQCLSLAHQLMDTPREEWNVGEPQEDGQSWGIPLQNDIMATNLSLLVEPANQLKGECGPRKAVLIVYSPNQQTSEFDYSVFRLQTARRKASKGNEQRSAKNPPHFVMTHKVLQGRLKNGARSVGPVSSVFIAGAWFCFDLRKMRQLTSKKSTDAEDYVVTLGVFRTPGGMESLCLGSDGAAWIHSVVKSEVSKCWLSDLVHSNTLLGTEGPPTATFSWVLELSNGELLCWSVPSAMACLNGQLDEWQISAAFKETSIDRPKGLRQPFPVCKRGNRNERKRFLLGALCDLGKVSDWIQQPSSGSQTAISLGQVPESKFGCILRSGQSVRSYSRNSTEFFELEDIKAYHQLPFLMTPPAFVTSISMLLLEVAFLRQELSSMESPNLDYLNTHFETHTIKLKVRYGKFLQHSLVNCSSSNYLLFQIIEKHIQHRLTTAPNKDAVMMALRLLIFRSVEMLTKIHKRHAIEKSDVSESNLLLSVELYAATVAAVRCCTSNLQYASLFLEVGRQIEPSCLHNLFPLPMATSQDSNITIPNSDNKELLDKFTARTVVDLFNLCIEERAMASAASALPLLTSKEQARHYCGLMLDETIDSFLRNTHSRNLRYDCTEEERRIIGDIFQFGMKLEDADVIENNALSNAMTEKVTNGSDDVSLGSLAHTNDSRTTNDDSIALHESQKGGQHLLCGLNGSSSILNYIVPSTILGESEKQKEEEAIRREASSFIKGSLDDPVLGFTSLPDWDNSLTSAHASDSDINSVSGLIGDALLDLLQSSRTNNNWKAMAALSKMLLQEGVKVPTLLKVFGQIASSADPLDIASILPERYNEHEECELNVVDYLSDEINHCAVQVGEADAYLIVHLALLILDRLEVLPLVDPGDQAIMELGLVVIILVAGKQSGTSQQILESISREDCLFHECYSAILDQNICTN